MTASEVIEDLLMAEMSVRASERVTASLLSALSDAGFSVARLEPYGRTDGVGGWYPSDEGDPDEPDDAFKSEPVYRIVQEEEKP